MCCKVLLQAAGSLKPPYTHEKYDHLCEPAPDLLALMLGHHAVERSTERRAPDIEDLVIDERARPLSQL